MTALSSRVLLVLMMLTFMMAEASQGAWRLRKRKARSSVVRPRARSVGVEGHRAREQRGCGHPIAEPGGAGGGVGPAGRPAHHREVLDPERVGELAYVVGPVEEASPRLVGRETHAGTIG